MGGFPSSGSGHTGASVQGPPTLVLLIFPLVFKATHSQFKCPFASNTGCHFLTEVQLIETDTGNPPSVCRNQHLRSSEDWFRSQSPKGQVPSRLAFFLLAILCSMWDPPQLGIEPGSPALLGAQAPNHSTTQEVPTTSLLMTDSVIFLITPQLHVCRIKLLEVFVYAKLY